MGFSIPVVPEFEMPPFPVVCGGILELPSIRSGGGAMSYFIETNSFGRGWTRSHPAGFRGYDCMDNAMTGFQRHTSLARMISPSRIVDSSGVVHAVYDPEKDTRLPGCRHRIISRLAYGLWEDAGRPDTDGVRFWLRAEKSLVESDGIEVCG